MADQLVKALDGLQHDAARRQEYNDWLQEFRRGVDSWQVSYEILESGAYPRGLKIFCAQTLRNKIIHDLHQVPRESRLHLKDQVLLLLEKNSNLLTVVGAHLCIALAAFAMQVAEWEHPVQELMARFDNVETAPLLFEFLKVLPEEFSSSRAGMVDAKLRLKKSETLIEDTAPMVLQFMLNRAEVMATSGDSQCLFFETLRPWLNEVDLPDIIASPLVDWMLASVSHEEARSASVDCLVSVLRETGDIAEPVVQSAINVLFPKIVELASAFSISDYQENSDLHRDMTRLLSEAAEAWHMLICRDPETFLPVLRAVKVCVAASTIESGDSVADSVAVLSDVVAYTYDVFDKMRTVLGEPLPGSSRPMSQRPSAEPFVPIFLTLFENFTRLLQFPVPVSPDSRGTGIANLEEEETFRDLRYDIGDMLKICSSIAGPERALELCHSHLHTLAQMQANQGAGHTPWQPVEALLFATRAIARTVPAEESEWLPKIYELFIGLPRSDNELVQHAALMLLGRYSTWSANHPQFLSFELKYILEAVWSPHLEVRRAAAHAFLFLCTDASRELVPFLPQIMEMYNALTGKADLESMCKYADGIGAVINHLPDDDLKEAVQFLFKPVQKRALQLQQTVHHGEHVSSEFQQQVAFDIQALGSMVAMVNAPECDFDTSFAHPLVSEVKAQHALFMAIMAASYSDKLNSEVLLEGIARYYIRAMFVLGANLSQELPSLMKVTAGIIVQEPMASVLYELSSAINQCFNASLFSYPPQLLESVWEYSICMCRALFSEKTTDLLKVQGEIVDHITLLSSVIHHGFHMLCDIAIYYPEQFLRTLLVPSVALSVQVFDLCWDIEALSAVSHFYDDLEGFLPVVGGPADETLNPVYIELIGNVFEQMGYSLVLSFFNWFLLKPDIHFESVVEHMVDLAFRMAPLASISWVQQLMDTLPAGTLSDEEKIVFSQHVFQLIGARKFTGIGLEMNNFLKAYSARNFQPR